MRSLVVRCVSRSHLNNIRLIIITLRNNVLTAWRRQTKRALTPRDFEFLKLIGRGTFGKVFQVRKKDTKRIYAMKVLSKKEIVAKKEVAHTIGERKILQRSLDSPFLVGLKFSFQTDADLYLITDFKSGGELFWHLQRETRFSEERARFYVAELVLALEHLHKFNIVYRSVNVQFTLCLASNFRHYRDLKPENILLDATGHVALCDFGLSKADLHPDELTTTFCGTTEYLAPEILLSEQGYSKIVDFWSLGVLLFEMCCGWSPFYAEDTQQMYKNICFGKIRFPKGVINEDGKQFVKGVSRYVSYRFWMTVPWFSYLFTTASQSESEASTRGCS
jgi:serine/threonine protein kinase SCH9